MTTAPSLASSAAPASPQTQQTPVLPAPPPSYSSGPAPVALAGTSEHLHAPFSAVQDLQYHQLFTRPSTVVSLTEPILPVTKLVETYPDDNEWKSNDPKLTDGMFSARYKLTLAALLYDFFRLKAAEPIRLIVNVHGSHTETEVYYTYRTNPHNNQREQVRQTRTKLITDFNFTVPVLPLPSGQPTDVTLYTASMGEGAEANPLPWNARESEKWKKSNGLPGWADAAVTREMYNLKNPTEPLPAPVPASIPEPASPPVGKEKDLELGLPVVEGTSTGPRGLKELCEAYVQDHGRLKEIEMKVEVYGWDQEKVIAAITNCIHATGYSSMIVVSFSSSPKRYIVRPFNSLTKLKRNFWLMVLACITLVYPAIWIFLHITGKDGEKYNTIRADHALKGYVPVEGTFPGETLVQAHARVHPADAARPAGHVDTSHRELVTGPLGVYAMSGIKEGVWLRTWEGKIAEAASNRYQGELTSDVAPGAVVGGGLDGY